MRQNQSMSLLKNLNHPEPYEQSMIYTEHYKKSLIQPPKQPSIQPDHAKPLSKTNTFKQDLIQTTNTRLEPRNSKKLAIRSNKPFKKQVLAWAIYVLGIFSITFALVFFLLQGSNTNSQTASNNTHQMTSNDSTANTIDTSAGNTSMNKASNSDTTTTTDKTTNHTTDKTIDKNTYQTTDKTADKNTDKNTDKTTDKTIDKNTYQTTDKTSKNKPTTNKEAKSTNPEQPNKQTPAPKNQTTPSKPVSHPTKLTTNPNNNGRSSRPKQSGSVLNKIIHFTRLKPRDSRVFNVRNPFLF